MTSGTLMIGLYQAQGVPGDVPANLAEMTEAMDRAAAEGIRLLVFPEGFLTGYYLPDVHSLPRTDTAVEQLREHARRCGVAIVTGLAESEGEGIANSAIAISRDGTILARYNKRALYGAWERAFFAPGREPASFTMDDFRIGILICYDVEFPELVRETAAAGADLIVVPTALMHPYDQIADHMIPTRALESQAYVAYADRCGSENGMSFVGKSSICDPLGRVMAKAGPTGPEMISARLDKAAIAESRGQFSYRDDLRRLRL